MSQKMLKFNSPLHSQTTALKEKIFWKFHSKTKKMSSAPKISTKVGNNPRKILRKPSNHS